LCENDEKNTNTLCEKNTEFQYVRAGGTYITTGLERFKHVLKICRMGGSHSGGYEALYFHLLGDVTPCNPSKVNRQPSCGTGVSERHFQAEWVLQLADSHGSVLQRWSFCPTTSQIQ
jgi:hypothetical protein